MAIFRLATSVIILSLPRRARLCSLSNESFLADGRVDDDHGDEDDRAQLEEEEEEKPKSGERGNPSR